MNGIKFVLAALVLVGCNSVYIKPNTLDTTQSIYATRGGYTMHRSIKERMEKRGYRVAVGKADAEQTFTGEDIDLNVNKIPTEARYIVKVGERREMFRPIWCALNGFWWWNFNVSIADQKTGQEILSWRGRGCENSSLRKLDKILDELEM